MTALKLEPGTEKPVLRDDQFVHLHRNRGQSAAYVSVAYQQSSWALTRRDDEGTAAFSIRSLEHGGPEVLKTVHAKPGQDQYELFTELDRGRSGHPWGDHAWFQEKWPDIAEHMIGRSDKHPGLLSYYQTEDKRAADVRTPIKPGKYLRKFFGEVLDEEQIQSLGIEFAEWAGPTVIKITADADEIEEVYTNGPRSCMSSPGDHYSGPEHPSRVYAGPDLGVAYVGTLSKPSARAVVWPDKKLHSVIYGDYHRMESALKELGYKEGDMDGARVQRIEHGDRFVMPYVDGIDYFDDDGDYLILGRGGTGCKLTSGVSERAHRCTECGDSISDDEAVYVEAVEGHVCEHCRDHEFFYCEVAGEHVRAEDTTTLGTGEQVSDGALEGDRFFQCEGSEEWYCHSPRHYWSIERTDMVVLADGTTWSQPHFDAHGAYCMASEDPYPVDELVEASNGELVHPDNLEDYEADFQDAKERTGVAHVAKPGTVDDPAQLTLPTDAPMYRVEGPVEEPLVAVRSGYERSEMVGLVGTLHTQREGRLWIVEFDPALRQNRTVAPFLHRTNGCCPGNNGRYFDGWEIEPLNDAARVILGGTGIEDVLAA